MATLEDLKIVLDSINETAEEQRDLLDSFIKGQERRERIANAARTDSSRTSSGSSSGSNRESTTIRGGISRGVESGVGGMFLGLAGGISILSKAAGAAVGLGAIGVGLAGFFTALGAADDAIEKLGDGSNLKTLMTNVGDGLESLDTQSMTALGGLLGASVLWSRFSGIRGMVKAPVGLAAIGLGIGGFMTGLSASGDLTGFDGSTFAKQAKNITSGLKAFGELDENTITALGALAASGALLGVVPGGLKIAGMAAVGLGAVGFALGNFITGFAASGDIASWLGADGSGMKNILINLAGGLQAFDGVDGKNFADIGTGMAALGAGLFAFMSTEGIGGITQGAIDTFNKVWSFFTGKETAERGGRFDVIAKELEAFNNKDYSGIETLSKLNLSDLLNDLAASLDSFTATSFNLATGPLGEFITNVIEPILGLEAEEDYDLDSISKFSDNLLNFSTALKSFDGIKKVDFSDLFDVQGAAESIGKMSELIGVITTGGTYETIGERKNARGQTIRGAKISMDLPPISQISMDAENIKEHLGKVREALGYNFMAPQLSPADQANLGLLETAISEGRSVIINAPNNAMTLAPQTSVTGGSTTLNASGGSSELDALSMPGGVQ